MSRHDLAIAAPHIPDLDAALEACAGMWVDIEVKSDLADPDWDRGTRVAARVSGQLLGRDDVLISSFDRDSVEVSVRAGMRSALVLDHGQELLPPSRWSRESRCSS